MDYTKVFVDDLSTIGGIRKASSTMQRHQGSTRQQSQALAEIGAGVSNKGQNIGQKSPKVGPNRQIPDRIPKRISKLWHLFENQKILRLSQANLGHNY
jgi:hypothetical protein